MIIAKKWQAMWWAWTKPARLRLRFTSINLNKKGTKTELCIRTSRKCIKRLIPQIMQRLSNEELALLTWGAILGDGSLSIVNYGTAKVPYIRIVAKDVNKWKELERLGFEKHEKYGFLDLRYSKARRYAKMLMKITSPRLKRLMDLLEIKKWETLKEFLQHKSFSHLQITIHGVAFTVQIKNGGYLKLFKRTKEPVRLCEELKKYNVNCTPGNGYVYISPMDVLELIKKDSKIKEQIITVLCMRFMEYREMGIFEKTQEMIKQALAKNAPIIAPTEGAAAAG